MHVRHSDYRLVVKADAPFPSGTSEDEWRRTLSREAVGDGYSLFRIGLSLADVPKDHV